MRCLRILISKAFKKTIFKLSFLAGALCLFLCPVSAKADGMVTDTLTVKVGYWGMDVDDFVEKDTYHWTELQSALPLHDIAYSFYRDGSGQINGTYGTVIDSARGFYIEDLITYAGINLRDIQSIQFYTKDVDIGYFTSFTYNELFSSERYFFHDLASYFKVIYKDSSSAGPEIDPPGEEETDPPGEEETDPPGEEETDPPEGEETDPPGGEETDPPGGEETDPPGEEGTDPPGEEGTDPPEGEGDLPPVGKSRNVIVIEQDKKRIDHVELDPAVWSDKEVVRPMLALEDSWVTYELPVEGTAPSFDSMGTSNRFRLLFGQATPTEQRTNQTAKYVHTLFVMLDGVPKVTEDEIKLPSKLGSNSITFNVSTADEALINQMIDGLTWTSSDDTVLKITDINIVQASQYDDAVQVTIEYDLLKEGEVTINGSYFGISVSGSISVPATQDPEEPDEADEPEEPNKPGESDKPGNSDEPGESDKPGGSDKPDNQDSMDGKPGDPDDSNNKPADGDKSLKGTEAGEENVQPADAGLEVAADTSEDSQMEKSTEDTKDTDQANETEEAVGDALASEGGVTMYTLDEQIAQLLAEREDALEYDELVVHVEEEKNHLPAVGAGMAVLFCAGIGGGYGEFKKRK